MDTIRARYLLREHRQIVLGPLAEAAAMADARLAQALGDVATRLRAYRRFKYDEVLWPVLAEGDTDLRGSAARMMLECDRAAAAFDGEMLRIRLEAKVDPAARRTATLALLAAVDAHVRQETRGIAALLAAWDAAHTAHVSSPCPLPARTRRPARPSA